ncbi:common central domain of tyrosinase-domain-containing protein [Boletus reticuloceps]|uniref:tyrosinase n=1 Tax=Boletus reticuloceps TaxID=495285 RepID=A0A8I3ABR5_9AGAM|nr:common central domain of tyrosinase-domain-containing protein [Boletus reticuloceps]
MARPYPVIGIEDTGIQPRLEIRDLQQNPIQFSLFTRALNNILDMNNVVSQSPDYIEQPNSWWQMAGIHGLPYEPWSGDPNGPQKADQNAQWGGYCYHASALFPTWHRVTTMLVEQAVVNEAITIATEFNNDTWLQAAKELRFAYWDWTDLETAQEGIPHIFQEAVVKIANPDGSHDQVSNPLNHYDFTLKPGVARGIEYMNTWNRTYRWPNEELNPTYEMYDEALKAFSEGATFQLGGSTTYLQPVSWLREKVAALFTYDLTLQDPSYGPNMWGYFSNIAAQYDGVDPPMPIMPPSIEEPHNMVHGNTGGNGTMTMTEYASFDPIFFLHHANVDRLYAFWEYVYADYWIADGWKSSDSGKTVPFVTDSGNFWQDAHASVDHATSLLPFRTKALDYWTSDNVRGLLNNSPTQKYYTYPVIKDPRTGVEVKVDVPYDTNNLTLRQQYQQALHNEWSPDTAAVVQAHRNLSGAMTQQTDVLMKEENDTAHLRQFIITGKLVESAFGGSHRLELFLLPKDGYQTGGDVVNSISVFSRASPEGGAGIHIRGNMYLDPRLILYLLSRLEPDQRAAITELDHVAALIHASLGVRLVKPDGKRLASTDPPVGTHHTPLEEAKAPKLTLHSQVIQLSPHGTAPIKIGNYSTHGAFKDNSSWREF